MKSFRFTFVLTVSSRNHKRSRPAPKCLAENPEEKQAPSSVRSTLRHRRLSPLPEPPAPWGEGAPGAAPRDYNSQQPPRRRAARGLHGVCCWGHRAFPRAPKCSVVFGKEMRVLHRARSILLRIMPPYWEGLPSVWNHTGPVLFPHSASPKHVFNHVFYPGHWNKESSKAFI